MKTMKPINWYAVGAPLPVIVRGKGRLRAVATADANGVTVRIEEWRDGLVCEIDLGEGDLVHLLEEVQSVPPKAG